MLNPGWTPPFRTDEFPMMKPLSWIDSDIADRNWYAGELSPLSGVTLQKLHPNSTLKPDIPAGEEVIASGLIKFRAGAHTDKLGVSSKVGCPFHVPWVWCETAVTYDYDRDDFKIYGRGAQFPSHAWYKNGEQLMSTNQVGDSSLPTSGLTINLAALKLYQILKKGAPAGGPQPAAGSDASHGPVSAHHYSVGAGERRIHRRL
jgi:hypothetical protein